LISHTVYHYLITNFGNFAALDNMVWSILLEVLFNGLIGLLVQSFLTLRVWRLSNHNIGLTALIIGLVLGEFVCSVVFTIQSSVLSYDVDCESLTSMIYQPAAHDMGPTEAAKELVYDCKCLGRGRGCPHRWSLVLFSPTFPDGFQKVGYDDYQTDVVCRQHWSFDDHLCDGIPFIYPGLGPDTYLRCVLFQPWATLQ